MTAEAAPLHSGTFLALLRTERPRGVEAPGGGPLRQPSGDIGRVDAEGFLYIADRKKDIIVTSGGINLAPQPIEARLRKDGFIEEAMVYGDRRPYPVALVSVAPGPLAALAAASGLSAVRGAPGAIVRAGRRADPTEKLRRKVVAGKYDDLLQSLYRAA